MTTSPARPDHDADITARAMQLVQAGRPNQAGKLLMEHMGRRMLNYYLRHRIPPHEAELLVNELWFRFLTSRFEERTRPVIWFWKLARSILNDWWRRELAQKRGGTEQTTVSLDDDELAGNSLNLEAIEPSSDEMPAWVKRCIHRAAEQLCRDDPKRAQLLWYKCQEMSAEDIAIIFGATPHPSTKEKHNATSRISEAMKKARNYFSSCRESD